ncbi:hypothetical protein GPECTOR_51g724 [Gonium pectorale]|uniref:Pentacotripeptide-repeat region of PRORP domain-containing protein n=1 Tax=Gonium pectorale TaxID=33097 RepID=A0A150G7D2_GONPE|nr:hypothetical protein GPECTOR_51g724 [Gonium pectorale]|eukprot:KXZ45738.1 hypothetical protein GPECTOR_51g724 [Gonium pectorale]
MRSEQDTVAYYSELLRRVAEAAAAAAAPASGASSPSAPSPPSPPFAGSAVPFGPALRAAAARRDLASVSEIVKQMRGLGCTPGADAYAAVIDASIRANKPERVAGLMALMEEERVPPTAAVWEVRLAAATSSGDLEALTGLAEEALLAGVKGFVYKRGVAGISEQVQGRSGEQLKTAQVVACG